MTSKGSGFLLPAQILYLAGLVDTLGGCCIVFC